MAVSFAYQKDWLALREPQLNTENDIHNAPDKPTEGADQ
jgi:hypothetical protein